jgi:tripartite-type tricarboxylate transporter receptor subunit TctC
LDSAWWLRIIQAAAVSPRRVLRCQLPPTATPWLCFTNGTSISVSLKNLMFNPLTDFAPVTKIGTFEFFFAANANAPYRTLADVIQVARDYPGKLNVGTVTAGSTQHLSAMLLKSTAAIDFQWVSFRTSPDVLIALLRGDIDVAIDALLLLEPASTTANCACSQRRLPPDLHCCRRFRPRRRLGSATSGRQPGMAFS